MKPKLKKILSMLLITLVMNLGVVSVFAETKTEKEAKFANKVKTEIKKLGTGTDAKIQVKLKDGTKLKGFVSQINENSFVVTDDKTGASTEVPYPQAKQVKGKNISTGVKTVIVIGIAIGIAVLVSLLIKGE